MQRPAISSHFKVFLTVLTGVLLWGVFTPSSATAQITKSSRVALTEDMRTMPLGESIYVTPDPDSTLSADVVGMRHQSSPRGAPNGSGIVNLGFTSGPTWLAFSITNNSDSDHWYLRLGSLNNGRMGLIDKLSVTEYSTHRIFYNYAGDGHAQQRLVNGAIPMYTARGKTALVVIKAEIKSGAVGALAPSAETESANAGVLDITPVSPAPWIFFIGACAAFACLAFVFRDRAYAYFSAMIALYALSYTAYDTLYLVDLPQLDTAVNLMQAGAVICGLYATRLFFGLHKDSSSESFTLTLLGLMVLCCALASFAPMQDIGPFEEIILLAPQILTATFLAGLSLQQAQADKAGGVLVAAGWALAMLGMLVTVGTGFQVLPVSAFNTNAWWLMLVPQSFMFFAAATQKFKSSKIEERAFFARESRAAQSLVQLRQSKESADQSRLLRVIERERELMTELRERESQRTDEMRKAKDMADKANAAKSAFLAVVSHEIRTPMNGMMGILRLMKDTKMTKDQSDYLVTIQKSGETMMALLNDILDFEKIESGNMDLEYIDFDLPRLVQGVTTLMIGHAASRGLYLRSEIPEDFPRFMKGDPNRLRQILLNLVNNGIKFTEKGGVKIVLRAAKIDPRKGAMTNADYDVTFAVEDTGIGISDEGQAKLFTPFQQAESSTARKYGGTGLGLVICQRLVEAMGGTINLTSEQGTGSTFYFNLPMRKADSDAEDQQSAIKIQERTTIPQMSLLVVEDNDVSRRVIRGFLEKDGHAVTDTERGQDAALLCGKNSFDAVFLDINLAGISGLDVARTIRSLPNAKKAAVPIIAITGNVAEGDIADIHEAGINDYLPKPVDFDQLLAVLRKIHREHYKPDAPMKSDILALKEQAANEVLKDDEIEMSPIQMFLRNIDHDARMEAAGGVNTDDIFDEKVLHSLAKALDKSQIAELMKSFVVKADEIVAAMTDNPEAQTTKQIMDRAHELKGMAANFGMKELSEIARRIEAAGRANTPQDAMEDIKSLTAANKRARGAIAQWLA